MSSRAPCLWNDVGSVVGNVPRGHYPASIRAERHGPIGDGPVASRRREHDEDPSAGVGSARPTPWRRPPTKRSTPSSRRSTTTTGRRSSASPRESTPAAIREAGVKGRVNGTLESIAVVLADACLADCIEQLGDHSDNPTSDQLREVLPGLVERHGVACTRLMLATTVVGEAPASAIVRDLLKHDDDVKLPPMEPRPIPPVVRRQARVRRRARGRQGQAPRAEAAPPGRGPRPPRAISPRPPSPLNRLRGLSRRN